NKLAFGAASAVALALAIGFAVSTVMYIRARAEKRKAQTQAINSEQIAKFLKKMLEGVGPSVAKGRDRTMLKEILDTTAESMGKELRDQPEVQAELRNTLGYVYEDLDEYEKAAEMHKAAVDLRRGLWGDENAKVADSLNNLGTVRWNQGRLAEAEALLREGL